MKALLTHRRVSTRVFSLWALGVIVNLVAWEIGYRFLPTAALKNVLPAGFFIPGHAGVLHTLLTILVYNVGLASGLIVVANLFRVKDIPLGYLPVLFHWSLYGLFLGTDSFGISRGVRATPSLAHLVPSVGFIEISAYTFIAAATINLYMFRQRSIWSLRSERVRSWSDVRLLRCEVVTVASAVALLFLAAFRESLSIVIHAH